MKGFEDQAKRCECNSLGQWQSEEISKVGCNIGERQMTESRQCCKVQNCLQPLNEGRGAPKIQLIAIVDPGCD